MSVCPTKAIRWKGSQLFVRENDTQAPVADGKPLTALLQKQAPMSALKTENAPETQVETHTEAQND